MSTFGNVAFAALAIAAVSWGFSLLMRYLQDGIAYLRHDQMVMDRAMPAQGVLLCTIAVVATLVVLDIDPAYPQGAGVLSLSVLGAGGGMGLLILPLYLMQRSSMTSSIEYHQPLFLRDRTPGCTSSRHVTVYVGGPATSETISRRTIHLR